MEKATFHVVSCSVKSTGEELGDASGQQPRSLFIVIGMISEVVPLAPFELEGDGSLYDCHLLKDYPVTYIYKITCNHM